LTILEAVILGIIQGLTEFLPVSSSGHLVILQSFFKNFQQSGISFDVFIHCATLLAVIVYFYKDIVEIISMKNKKWILLIIIATIPAGIVGVLFKDQIETAFSNVILVCIMLIITGIMLFISDKFTNLAKDKKDITILDSIIIGCFQAFAILPGISRSGSTISAGIFRGLKRDVATKFSFILSIPAIFGALILSLKDFKNIPSTSYIPYISGFISAFVVGLISLKLLTIIIKSKNLKYFSYYCWILSIVVFICYEF
jgi:undecaprenyl-diphosphatase